MDLKGVMLNENNNSNPVSKGYMLYASLVEVSWNDNMIDIENRLVVTRGLGRCGGNYKEVIWGSVFVVTEQFCIPIVIGVTQIHTCVEILEYCMLKIINNNNNNNERM